jgi:hypothetical protein
MPYNDPEDLWDIGDIYGWFRLALVFAVCYFHNCFQLLFRVSIRLYLTIPLQCLYLMFLPYIRCFSHLMFLPYVQCFTQMAIAIINLYNYHILLHSLQSIQYTDHDHWCLSCRISVSSRFRILSFCILRLWPPSQPKYSPTSPYTQKSYQNFGKMNSFLPRAGKYPKIFPQTVPSL